MEIRCLTCRYSDENGHGCTHEDGACSLSVKGYPFWEPKEVIPEKTLLDEFAMAAMERIIAKRPYTIAHSDDELAMANRIVNADCRGAYSYAAAMMAERARRDEMGRVIS